MTRTLGRFLWSALDVGLGLSYGDDTDCIRFQFAVLLAMYPEVVDIAAHHRLLHLDGQPVGSLANMAKLVELGIGTEALDADIRGVYAMQGWNGGRGHALFLIRTRRRGLWTVDFTTATNDSMRPIEWATVVRKWPSRMVVKLREPA